MRLLWGNVFWIFTPKLLYFKLLVILWAGYRSRYCDWLRAGRSGDGIPVGARFSTLVQTGPRAHPASCTTGTGSFPGVKSGRGVTLTFHPLLVPLSRKGRAIPLLPLWAVRPVQSLSACTRVHFYLYLCIYTCCHSFAKISVSLVGLCVGLVSFVLWNYYIFLLSCITWLWSNQHSIPAWLHVSFSVETCTFVCCIAVRTGDRTCTV